MNPTVDSDTKRQPHSVQGAVVRLGWVTALVWLVGCAPDPMSGTAWEDGLERQDATSRLCSFGGWAANEDSHSVVHVCDGGSDVDGNGSLRHPYATVDAALEGLRAG